MSEIHPLTTAQLYFLNFFALVMIFQHNRHFLFFNPIKDSNNHHDLSLVNSLFIKRSDVLDKPERSYFYCCGMKDRVIIKTSVCHLSSEHILHRGLDTCFVRAYLEARWCLPMQEQPQVETNRWDLRKPSRRQVQKTSISVRGWEKRACSGEKGTNMIHTQPPTPRKNNIVAERKGIMGEL